MFTVNPKRKKSHIVALALTIMMVMSLFPTLVSADMSYDCEVERHQMAEVIDDLSSTILTTTSYADEMSYVVEIRGLTDLRDAIIESYPQLSDYELARAILRTLGETDEQIDDMPLELILGALEYTAVIISESYFGVAYDGSKIEMTRDEFHVDVATMKALDLIADFAMSSSLPGDNRTHGNLILRTHIARIATSGNRFMINAEAEWVRLPLFRNINMLAIGHTSTANICNILVGGATARYVFGSRSTTDSAARDRNGMFMTMQPTLNGMGVSYHLAPGICCCSVYMISGSIRLWHGITIPTGNTTNVMVGYGQRGLNFFGSIGFSISGSGPSISFSPSISTTTFTGWPLALRWDAGL
ncbi:MAG: hypothetical protein FWE42_00070 [Defluviitaleaceae bacterium]|nr:hypothetical protein [Defluviitaleaceae bacterium]